METLGGLLWDTIQYNPIDTPRIQRAQRSPGCPRLTVSRARKIQKFLSQPFHVAEVFTGTKGRFVSLEDTISGFRGLLDGKYDDLPEGAFYMVGDINEAISKAKQMASELEE